MWIPNLICNLSVSSEGTVHKILVSKQQNLFRGEERKLCLLTNLKYKIKRLKAGERDGNQNPSHRRHCWDQKGLKTDFEGADFDDFSKLHSFGVKKIRLLS